MSPGVRSLLVSSLFLFSSMGLSRVSVAAPQPTPLLEVAPGIVINPISPLEQASMQSVAQIDADPDFINVGTFPNVKLDLRYAGENNFLKKNLYGSFNRAYLHKVAAAKLKQALDGLTKLKPGYQLLLFDALRPRSVQRLLWEAVVKTPQEKYVADPEAGSIHNYGFAIDLTLLDETGKEVDMGTSFDFFGPLSEPALEEKFLKGGQLTALQVGNRRLLRKVMTEAGFSQLASEWWHYDALPAHDVRRGYKIVE